MKNRKFLIKKWRGLKTTIVKLKLIFKKVNKSKKRSIKRKKKAVYNHL
jgi:hypothetical protein